jgi:hypothetical protein
MKRGLFVACVLLLGASAGLGQEAQPAAAPASSAAAENLHAAVAGGMMTMEGEESTWLASGSINYGFPVVDVVRLGAQVGGKVTMRDDEPDWLASIGLFQRGVELGNAKTAWAIQGVYQNTWRKADLISLKPTFGIELDKYDYLALTGVVGLNEEQIARSAAGTVNQQPVDQAMLVWGAEWSDRFRTELGAGYAFQDIDSILLGAQAGIMVNDVTSVNLTGACDFRGNYYTAVGLAFDIGATGRNAGFNNVAMKTANDYTPFPLGSLPVVFYETQVTEAAAPAPSGPPAPPPLPE